MNQSFDLKALLVESGVSAVLDELDAELIGLVPVKLRIREIASLLVVEKARAELGVASTKPSLHMCFTGNPGTGKTTVAMRMAAILHRLGHVRRGQMVAVTRDDLVGQYIGHTAPKTREVLKRAMGGVLFIDEAYYLYRPENERDYGQEAIEILMQVMENQREDLVVIFAGYKSRMDTFFQSNPGLGSRVAHHIDFPDYDVPELEQIAGRMVAALGLELSESASAALREYLVLRRSRPNFANARSLRNALDRARLRQARRLLDAGQVDARMLTTIEAADIRASRVFTEAAPAPAGEVRMLNPGYTTISKFLIQQVPEQPHGRELAALLVDVAAVVKAISAAVGKGPLLGLASLAGSENAQGEAQKKLDLVADELFARGVEWSGLVGALASEERDDVHFIEGNGPLALVFDPLDGSSNLDVNLPVGSIFSVFALPGNDRSSGAVLQPGGRQLAAGYAVYGPSTQVVITVGRGTHGFTLDREIGNFVLTHPDIRIPEEGTDYLINASNRRFWEPPVQRYVDECKAGAEGPRGRDFNTRWVASMVADVHRVLLRGGIYLYPRDQKEANREGRLRLLYEANPMAMLVEQAGGAASTGRGRILDVQPERIHQRVPVILGSRAEVERVERYHAEFDKGEDKPYSSPLFGERSLFTNA